MPTLDSDHNHNSFGRRRQDSQSSGYGASTQPTLDRLNPAPASASDHSLPLLPAYAYNQSSVRPTPDTVQYGESSVNSNLNGFTADKYRETNSPDPHDFYRRYRDPFVGESTDALEQPDMITARREHNMTAPRQQRRPSPVTTKPNGSKLTPLTSRIHTSYGSRNSSADSSPLASTKSASNLPTAGRNRQTSLKDLVNRFNQTPDEIPPLPRKSASRSTSTNSNPPTSTKHAKARTLSESKGAGVGTVAKGDLSRPEYPGKPVRLHQRRGRKGEGMGISPISATAMTVSHPIRPHPKAYASQSMTDLHPDHAPSVRKPLFGEILASGSDRGDLGYGILGPRRRRGSEGSMHSPNPMFPNERNHRTVSPSSPSAWYLGVTPTLEEIKTEKTIPTLPPKMHRRTRSDFTGIPHRPPSPVSPIAPVPSNSHQNSARSPISPRAYKRDSQSRIPISSRRLSLNSDSSNSTPSTRTNSALERHSGQFGVTKGFSAIPKPSQKPTSPIQTSRPKPSRNSPRRGEFGPGQRAATSPRLAAYISAPLPKKSPPLRSSRPRLPVSSASTSASRARAVDRLIGQEGGSFKTGRDPYRSRKPPELGGVDFAARRQKIQQAFTKTVKENERQEVEAEKKRISMAQECPPPLQEELELETLGDQLGDHQLDDQSLHLESHDEPECEDFQTPAEELTKSERELTIQTGNLSERSVLNLSLEDSPTLGGYNHFPKLQRVSEGPATPPSDPEPSSAVTADTSDSVDTYFDNEPQEDPPSSYREHRTLLNHIMNMRDTSPKSPTSTRRSATADESASEKDDQESIKIMLGETPVLETAPYGEGAEDIAKDIDHDEQPASRWDLTSKTVSTRLKDNATLDERDAPMERIDENSPTKQIDAAHLSMSTASTNQTPQPWSPATFSSPLTNRTTMGSDTYSTINRVFDHYHDPNVVSPKLMNDVQQHIITQSPDLARQGGWDPKKVTQLYLQELARTRYAQSAVVPSALNPQSRKLVESDVSVSNHEKSLSSSIVQEKAEPPEVTHSVEAQAEKEHMPPRTRPDINDNTEYNPFRASLNVAADWDMSPSISDWIYLRAVDSPLDEKPALPPKDWKKPVELAAPESTFPVRPLVSRISSDFRPELPEIQSAGDGLGIGIGGLAINITEPQDDDSPTIIAPPLPKYLPPPPPVESVDRDFSTSTQAPSPPSPAIHPKHESLSSLTRAPAGDMNSKELHRQSNQTVSTQPATPVATSEDRQSMEMSSVASEAAKAAPPSPEQKRLTRRRHIIKELVDTEHSFGQDMKVVDDIYKGTSNVIIISAEDVKTLFGNSDQIVAFSTNFLDALKQAAKGVYVLAKSKRWRSNRTSSATTNSGNTDDQSSISGGELTDEERDRKTFIGDAFGHHMANMEKIYGDYLKNHDAANQKLQILQKNQKVQIWLKECRAYAHDLTSAWDLDSLLVKPVQRILKYPLLLDQLLEVTPENHPDFTRLDVAAREMKGISMRINEMKKRADLMEQVANNNRKRKESDVRIGLAKAFGRRTEKLRQQVGLSEFVEDKVYAAVSERFGSHFFQLQVVMRDVEMYTSDVQIFMNRFNDFVLAIEAHIDVGQSSYPEVESKWRKFRMSTREISMTALTDHVS